MQRRQQRVQPRRVRGRVPTSHPDDQGRASARGFVPHFPAPGELGRPGQEIFAHSASPRPERFFGLPPNLLVDQEQFLFP